MIFGRGRGERAVARPQRRATDRRRNERRIRLRRANDQIMSAGWDEQRAQFVTRYLFAALGLAYFNFNESIAGDAGRLLAANAVHLLYVVLTTGYLMHAWRRATSPMRLRVAMLTDVAGVSAAAYLDPYVASPALLVYVVIVLGNGMRYGLRAFAESAASGFVFAAIVLGLRFEDYFQRLSVTSLFYVLFLGIIILYSYSLMANIERARRNLEATSLNDALTGLLNRRGLQERAAALFESMRPGEASLAVLFADLDGFKAVNDAFGHDAGDRMLREIGQALAAQARATDVVARFGGDEFVLIMPETTIEQAARVAKRLQDVVTKVGEGNAGLSVTIGMGMAPDDGADLEAVLKAVDAAMYQGKLLGGGIRRADGAAVA